MGSEGEQFQVHSATAYGSGHGPRWKGRLRAEEHTLGTRAPQPREFAPVSTDRAVIPGSPEHCTTRCPPSQLCRTGISTPFSVVPEHNPKQTSKLSKHTFLTA